VAEFRVLPDIEKALVALFKADSVVATAVAGRVSTELPSGFVPEKRLQVFRTSGAPVDFSEAIDRPVVQINAFGKTKADAWAVIVEACIALKKAEGKTFMDVFVAACERVTGPQWAPDPSTDAPRYFVTYGITAHS
jgi:hypothetical protein